MFGSQRAGLALIVWFAFVSISAILSPSSLIFTGIVAGSVVTAAMLVLVVKWSIEDMFDDVSSDLKAVNESLVEDDDQKT